MLDALKEMALALGRVPEADECAASREIIEHVGTLKRALARRATGEDEWAALTRRASEDLFAYLALGKFEGRPPVSVLPFGLQREIRAFFGSYKAACDLADGLLFGADDPAAVAEACRRS